jgi:integrase
MVTEKQIRAAKPQEKPYKLNDGRGLILVVTPQGSKLWRYRYRFDGRDTMLSLGGYPDIDLKTARERLQEARTMVAKGINPTAVKAAARDDRDDQLEIVCGQWLNTFYPEDTDNKRLIQARFATYIYPTLGKRPMRKISALDVLGCLNLMVAGGLRDAQHRCKRDLSRVWRWAQGQEKVDRNVIDGLDGQLKRTKGGKHPGLTDPHEIGKLMLISQGPYRGQVEMHLYAQILPYVFTRPSELREARWSEFDLSAKIWVIPPERMKRDRPHVVPLATQVVDLLKNLSRYSGHLEILFPGIVAKDQPFSDATYNLWLRSRGYDTRKQHCGHGWRTTASTTLARLNFPQRAREMQLAHLIPGIEGKYNEYDSIAERIPMMQSYADHLDSLRSAAQAGGADHSLPEMTARMKSSMSDASQRAH